MSYTAYKKDQFPAMQLRSQWRAQVLPDLDGDVLDVGAGSGASLGHLPLSARVTLLEPDRASVRRLERLAARRRGARVVRARAERTGLPPASVDAAVCCAVLCSVADQDRVLAELHRVVRPGGRLVLFEHVAAERGTWLRRGQRALAPFSRWLDHGCDPARDTEAALARSPFQARELVRVDATTSWGPRIPHVLAAMTRPA